MDAVNPMALAWLVMAGVMAVFFWIQTRSRNATLVDVVWAAGVGSVSIVYAIGGDGHPQRRVLVAGLIGCWSLRLAWHLWRRSLGRPEDGRYRMLRDAWGQQGQRNFFWFYQMQAFWTILFTVPVWAVVANARPLGAWHDWVALTIWLVAVAGEALADAQLERFRSQTTHQGKTCDQGLWHYSRHPNYFFEWLHWFTYAALAVGSPFAWVAWAGPVVMLFFLYKVTGIPYTEKCALASRGDDYRAYQQRTSAFFPWFPKGQ